jgi:hypothetical protein
VKAVLGPSPVEADNHWAVPGFLDDFKDQEEAAEKGDYTRHQPENSLRLCSEG